MLNLKAGQTGTVTFTFQDNTQTPPVSYPLAEPFAPTIDDPGKATLVVTKDGTEDGIATATVTPVAGATPGPFNITGTGYGDINHGAPIEANYACAILANDDNAVVITSEVN